MPVLIELCLGALCIIMHYDYGMHYGYYAFLERLRALCSHRALRKVSLACHRALRKASLACYALLYKVCERGLDSKLAAMALQSHLAALATQQPSSIIALAPPNY